MYRCANNIYINQFYHPKSLFHNFLYFNEINCIFWEYFIDLVLRRRHYIQVIKRPIANVLISKYT